MHYAYRIQSISNTNFSYTGFTSNLKQRIIAHNNSQVKSTKNYKPYELIFYAALRKKEDAFNFERYLKTGSGKAFASKRLWPNKDSSKLSD